MALKQILLAGTGALALLSASPNLASAGEREMAVAVTCTQITATPLDYAACVGAGLTANELAKCIPHFDAKTCFGKGNELRKVWEKNIAGPADDLRRGDLGSSDASVWRRMGLPRVKLF